MARRLVPVRTPKRAEGAVLVLHGGAARQAGRAVSPTQLSVLRMVPIAHRLARSGRGRLAVYRLLNSVRGWDTEHTPVSDVQWALGALREQLPVNTPVGLVGHSLGGRAALLSVGETDVRCVAALAPWVYAADGSTDATGRDVLIVHGTADRIADPARSLAAARLLERTAASMSYVRVIGGKHAMLRRHAIFGRLATDFTVTTLLGSDRARPDTVLERARAGAPVDV